MNIEDVIKEMPILNKFGENVDCLDGLGQYLKFLYKYGENDITTKKAKLNLKQVIKEYFPEVDKISDFIIKLTLFYIAKKGEKHFINFVLSFE